MVGRLYPMLAGQLALRPEDDLLDVGCGSAMLLAEQAAHVRHVAGLDASEIQVGHGPQAPRRAHRRGQRRDRPG